jgi:hypothetical protein
VPSTVFGVLRSIARSKYPVTSVAWECPSQKTIEGILVSEKPDDADAAVYTKFINFLMWRELVGVIGSDVREWRAAIVPLWKDFTELAAEKKYSAADLSGRVALNSLHSLMTGRFEVYRQHALGAAGIDASRASRSAGGGGGGGAASASPPETKLPTYSRYLLVAAYVASHNPPDQDIRYFSRARSGKRRAKRPPSGCTLPMGDGPFAFSVERLLAITSKLVAEIESPTAAHELALTDLCLHALTTLERAGLVLRVDLPPERGGGTGFAAAVPTATALAVAATLKKSGADDGAGDEDGEPLDLDKFLHDFTVG